MVGEGAELGTDAVSVDQSFDYYQHKYTLLAALAAYAQNLLHEKRKGRRNRPPRQTKRAKAMRATRKFQGRLMTWYGCLLEVYLALSPAEKDSLERWESQPDFGSSAGTSDWPGWEKYIGKRPVFSQVNPLNGGQAYE
jgi:hypothetical protein